MKTDHKTEQILNGNLVKIMMIITFPVIITNFIESIYGIIDSLFVAHIGSLEVAAVTFVSPIEDTMVAIGIGLAIGGSSLIARSIGEKNEQQVKHLIMQIMILAIILGMGIGLLGNLFSEVILKKVAITESLLPVAKPYFQLIILSIPFTFISASYLGIKRAEGDTKKAMRINLYSLMVKFICTYTLVYVFDFGIIGVGISTIIGRGLIAAIAIYELFINKKTSQISLDKLKIKFNIMGLIFIVASPLMVEKSLISFGFVIVNKYVLQFGESVLAAYGITNKINSVLFKSTTAFGVALAVIVGQNLGANNLARAKEATRKSFMLAIGFAVMVVSIVLPLKDKIAILFTSIQNEVFYHIMNAMSIYTVSIIPWAVTEVVMGVFQGAALTRYNLMVSVMRIYLFRVPVVILLTNSLWGLNECGIWYAMIVSNILSAMFSLTLYVVKKDKLNVKKRMRGGKI